MLVHHFEICVLKDIIPRFPFHLVNLLEQISGDNLH